MNDNKPPLKPKDNLLVFPNHPRVPSHLQDSSKNETPTFEERYNTTHRNLSFIKSALRIASGCVAMVLATIHLPLAVFFLGLGLIVAEIVGIYEEL